jgi:hypothetical protein
MKQTMISEIAANSVRISAISDKYQRTLEAALNRWFQNEILKNIKLPLLKTIYRSGSLDSFITLLAKRPDADRIKVLHKIDQYNSKVQMLPAREAFAHVEQLAKGEILPHPKPAKAPKGAPRKKEPPKGVLASSKY